MDGTGRYKNLWSVLSMNYGRLKLCEALVNCQYRLDQFRNIALLTLFILISCSHKTIAQSQYGNKNYFLIDSLNLADLSESDSTLIDTTLKSYHAAESDTDRLNCLSHIVEACWDAAVWPRYNELAYSMCKDQLADGTLTGKLLLFYTKKLSWAMNNIAFVFDEEGNVKMALQYYHEALQISKETGDKEGIASLLNNIGFIYRQQGDLDKGLQYFNRSVVLREEIGSKINLGYTLNNIGAIYHDKDEYMAALEYYYRAVVIQKELEDINGLAYSYNNIGSVLEDVKEIDKALQYYFLSLEIRKKLQYKEGISSTLYNVGRLYFKNGDIESARKFGAESYAIARELGYPLFIRDAANLLSDVFKLQGNFKKALEMYELQVLNNDSIYNEKNLKESIRSQTKFEFEKAQLIAEQVQKEELRIKDAALKRRDNLQYSVIVIVIVIVFGLIATLTRINISTRILEGLIFFSFLIFFEFLLVLADPYIDGWSGGAPGFKLLFNAGIAAMIFPLHAFFESTIKKRLSRR